MATENERNLRKEIEAEIADHLASAADEYQRGGAEAEDAHRRASERFGDVARVVRRCLWAQRGDEIMLRAIGVGLVALLTVAVIVVAWGSWRAQRTLGERLAQLGDQLESLSASQERIAETQRDLADAPRQQTAPRITGRMLFGERVLSRQELRAQIWKQDDGSQFQGQVREFRQLHVAEDGTFDSGPLPPGEYIVTALLDTSEQTREVLPYTRWWVQSRTLYLYYAGVELPYVELDLCPQCELSVELAEHLPDRIAVGDLEIEIALRPLLIFVAPPARSFPVQVHAPELIQRTEVSKWPAIYPQDGWSPMPALGMPSEMPWRLTVPAEEYRFAVIVQGILREAPDELIEELGLAQVKPIEA